MTEGTFEMKSNELWDALLRFVRTRPIVTTVAVTDLEQAQDKPTRRKWRASYAGASDDQQDRRTVRHALEAPRQAARARWSRSEDQ